MIHILAGAQVGEYEGNPLLSMAFFEAVTDLKKLPVEEIETRYQGLKAIDAMPPITDEGIVWIDGSDDEVPYVSAS